MNKLALILLAVLALGSISFGQDPAALAPPKEMASLDWILGKWSGTHTFNDPGGKPSKSKAEIVFDRYLGKRFVRGTFTGSIAGMGKMEGVHLTTFDPQSKSWKGWWFDNFESGVMEVDGTLKNGVLSQTSKPIEMPGAGPQTFRSTYTRVDAKHLKFRLEVKTGDGWTTMMEGSYAKK